MNINRYRPRLLLWIWDEADRELDRWTPCSEFGSQQSIPPSAVWSLVDHLHADGLIRIRGERDGAPQVALLSTGADEARWLQAQRASPIARGQYANKAVLHWIHGHADRRPLRISGFLDSPEMFFLGEALTRGEVARALSYLSDSRLITCEGPAFHNDVGSYVALTSLGVDAVHSELWIDEFMAQVRRQEAAGRQTNIQAGSVVYTERGDVYAGTTNSVVIHAAYSPSDLARAIRELAPALALDPQLREELLATARELEEQGDTSDEQGRDEQRGRMERMRGLLGTAADTIGRQLLLDAIGQTLGRLLGS